MKIPGFTADAAAYSNAGQYYLRGLYAADGSHSITPAGTCSCPNCPDANCACTCNLPPPPPPPPPDCRRCNGLSPCGRLRCLCDCNGGFPVNNQHAPCGFLCT